MLGLTKNSFQNKEEIIKIFSQKSSNLMVISFMIVFLNNRLKNFFRNEYTIIKKFLESFF